MADELYMPFQRTQLDAGTHESPSESVEGFAEAVYRMNAALPSWDDPDLRVTVETWQSVDGGEKWTMIKSTNFVGNSRGKDGELPGFSLSSDRTKGLIKIRMSVNRQIRLGIDGTKVEQKL